MNKICRTCTHLRDARDGDDPTCSVWPISGVYLVAGEYLYGHGFNPIADINMTCPIGKWEPEIITFIRNVIISWEDGKCLLCNAPVKHIDGWGDECTTCHAGMNDSRYLEAIKSHIEAFPTPNPAAEDDDDE